MNLLKTKVIQHKNLTELQATETSKHFPVSTREWNNSIYVYNKDTLNSLGVASMYATKIIKGYFSLINNMEKKLKTRNIFRRKKRSKNKIFVSDNEFKHTNDKVIVNLYLFNRQNKNYSVLLRKKYNYWNNPKKYKNAYSVKGIFWTRYKEYFYKKIDFLLHALGSLEREYAIVNMYLNRHMVNHYGLPLIKLLNKLDISYINFKDNIKNKMLNKWELYFQYRQLIYINKSKYNYTYLQYLKLYLQKIFNKDIEFNLVNLKRFYLNSSIMSESIKLKLARNRRKILMYLTKLRDKVKVKNKNFLEPSVSYFATDNNHIQANIIKNIKHKHVTGFRLEAKGRLTKRHTASRSLSKVKYKGNLLNLDSSRKGLSTVILKGNLKANLQYTKLKSKTRIGSFGLKGWVSGN